VVCFVGSGCYSPKPIPADYFDQEPEMSVTVDKCPAKPRLADSGDAGGNLITAAVAGVSAMGRAGKMRDAMEGISGDTVKELVRQRFETAIEDYFDVYEEGQLQTTIDIDQWGWFVPTSVAGIRSGAYQFTLSGMVTIKDTEKKRKSKIAMIKTTAVAKIGDKPTSKESQEALLKCADSFATQAVSFLTKEQAGSP
jgi:hypothetical protein